MRGTIGAVSAMALMAFTGAANANTLEITYYEISEPNYGADFGICCSSPPATYEAVSVGDRLGPDGLPVNEGNVADVNGSGEILWWTPGTHNGDTVATTGNATITLDYASNMYAPNSTGVNDSSYFETAVLTGVVMGHGSDVTFNVSADDDVMVYLNGVYVGGAQGVHGTSGGLINLGTLSGPNTLQIFYADRAHTGANLSITGFSGGSVVAAPEASTWAMMGLGFAGLGLAGFRARKAHSVAIDA